MTSNHALKLEFINALRPDLKMSIRTQINYDMSFDEIVTKATIIADIHKSASNKLTPAKDKQWSAGKPMKFEKSNYQMDPAKKANAAKVANKKGGSGRTFEHFPNARNDKTKYTSFSEREKPKVEGKCYICKK